MEVLKAKMQQSKDELENVREEAVMKEKMFQEEKRKREEIENHISSLSRKITLLEEDLDRSEERYNVANSKLASANQMAEESERLVKSLREKTDQDDGKLSLMEDQAASAKTLAEDSDRQVTEYINKKIFLCSRKYEEAARKLALLETDLERAEERAEVGESKIVELEEEVDDDPECFLLFSL